MWDPGLVETLVTIVAYQLIVITVHATARRWRNNPLTVDEWFTSLGLLTALPALVTLVLPLLGVVLGLVAMFVNVLWVIGSVCTSRVRGTKES
jgi:hypothetical protein